MSKERKHVEHRAYVVPRFRQVVCCVGLLSVLAALCASPQLHASQSRSDSRSKEPSLLQVLTLDHPDDFTIVYREKGSSRVIQTLFFCVMALGCLYVLQDNTLIPSTLRAYSSFVNGGLCLGALMCFYRIYIALFYVSRIHCQLKTIAVPSSCLDRSFFSIFYFLIAPLFNTLDTIPYSDIAYVDLITVRQQMTERSETKVGKDNIFGIVDLHKKYLKGSQHNIDKRSIVLVRKDGRIYTLQESFCRTYNAFAMLKALFKERKIRVFVKNS